MIAVLYRPTDFLETVPSPLNFTPFPLIPSPSLDHPSTFFSLFKAHLLHFFHLHLPHSPWFLLRSLVLSLLLTATLTHMPKTSGHSKLDNEW